MTDRPTSPVTESRSQQQPGADRPSPAPLMELSFAFASTQILQSAIELDLFTQIDNGHRAAADLARACNATERGIRIVANALVGQKVLNKTDNEYHLTDTARTFLSKNSRAYMGNWVAHVHKLNEPWMHLTDVVRTGHPARELHSQKFAEDFFSQFVGSLYIMAKPGADAAAATVVGDRRGLQVLDVGAGSGVWSIAVAQRDPQAHVTLVDFPKVLEVAKHFVDENGLSGRFAYMPGNLREVDFGENKYDVVTLGHILHGEGERNGKALLRKIRRALKPGGQLIIAEFLVDDARKDNAFALIFAVNMLVNMEEGDTFSASELRNWLLEAGFADVDLLSAPAPSPLVIGKVAAAKAERKIA